MVLARLSGRISGNVKLIFQPAEEGGFGARRLCELGVMAQPKVSAVFGLHGFNDVRVGSIGVKDGPLTACADQFYISVTGKGAHGAYPDRAIDPVVTAARIVDALQHIVAREVTPMNPAVCTVGTIHAGTAENIIPVTAEMSGTLRAYDLPTRELLISSLKRIVRGTAAAMGAKARVRIQRGYPATVNDGQMADVVRAAGRDALGAGKVIEIDTPTMGAEDFSMYLEHAPGAFFRLGTGDGSGKQGAAHSPYFDFNDKAIPVGVKMFVSIVSQMLS
jgi:amidohydrolase